MLWILLVLAFLCFVADAFGLWNDNPRRPALMPLGLAFFCLWRILTLWPGR